MSLNDPYADGWARAIGAAVEWLPADRPTLVVVPHPDDEAVMFGGLIARLGRRRAPVRVLAVSDGGAAYPDIADRSALEHDRRNEQRAAIEALGLQVGDVERLGLPDGEIERHESLLVGLIARRAEERGCDQIVAPWELDHHTDHEACGRAALEAAGHLPGRTTLVSGFFWSILRERPTPGLQLRALPLTQGERVAKSAAIRCHRSQTERPGHERSVLTADELSITGWPFEHYLVRDVD